MGELQSTLGSVDLHHKLGLPGLWYSDGQAKLLSLLGAAEQTVDSGSMNSTHLQHLLTRPTRAFLLRASNHCFSRDPQVTALPRNWSGARLGPFHPEPSLPETGKQPCLDHSLPLPCRAPLAER